MASFYLGTLCRKDPLYEILLNEICPRASSPVFHVDLTSSKRVYKYTEEKSRISIIGKFFRHDDPKPERALRIRGEYDNLKRIRSLGFDREPHYVVRPIGKEERIGLALIEDFVKGKDLDFYFRKAIYDQDTFLLGRQLKKLASFLHAIHSRTRSGRGVDLGQIQLYYEKLLGQLGKKEVVAKGEVKPYLKLVERWMGRSLLSKAEDSIVHGDATPTNFLFTGSGDVVAIDLERMKSADPVYDLGMICAELKHAFMWRKGDPYGAEPFISYFLKSYCEKFHDAKKGFRMITLRNPFYMAMAELRIARNAYLDMGYRRGLAYEALKCLKWGLWL